jgi:hypothetical protein
MEKSSSVLEFQIASGIEKCGGKVFYRLIANEKDRRCVSRPLFVWLPLWAPEPAQGKQQQN